MVEVDYSDGFVWTEGRGLSAVRAWALARWAESYGKLSEPDDDIAAPPASAPKRRLYTPSEAAAILGVTEAQLTEFVRHGEMSYVDLGRGRKKKRRGYEDADIERFLAARRRTEQWPKSPAPSKSGQDRRNSNTGLGSVDATFMSRLKQRRAATQNAKSVSSSSKPKPKRTP